MGRATMSGGRAGVWLGAALLLGGGCGHKSSLLMERQSHGPISGDTGIAQVVNWAVTPATQTKTQSGVAVDVTWASPAFLKDFFSHQKIFGKYAGLNPYFPEQMVFYVKVSNTSGKKILLDPGRCALLDDRGNQYLPLNIDYTTTLAETKTPITTMTRGVLKDASPGYFGFSVPLGRMLVGEKPSRRFALLKLATLQPGFLQDSVSYDGLIAYWSPHSEARKLHLLVAEVKADFSASDEARTSLDFVFDFDAAPATHP